MNHRYNYHKQQLLEFYHLASISFSDVTSRLRHSQGPFASRDYSSMAYGIEVPVVTDLTNIGVNEIGIWVKSLGNLINILM